MRTDNVAVVQSAPTARKSWQERLPKAKELLDDFFDEIAGHPREKELQQDLFALKKKLEPDSNSV